MVGHEIAPNGLPKTLTNEASETFSIIIRLTRVPMSELTWSSGDHRTSREPVAYVGKNVVVGNPLAMSGIQSYRNLGPLLLGIHPNYSRTCSLSLSLSLSSSIPCVMRMSRSDHHGSADQLKNPTQIKVCARKSHPDRKKEKNKQLTAPNTAMINDYLRPKTGPHKVFFTLASCSHVRCPMCRRNHCSLLPLHFFPPAPPFALYQMGEY